jgi:UDP:flavonoid glycosyltransferase YjiC (YdhE family)
VATIALVLFPELGHVHGALGLAKLLRGAGHDVVAIGRAGGAAQAAVEREGIGYRGALADDGWDRDGGVGRALAALAPAAVLADANLASTWWLAGQRGAVLHTALPNVQVAGRGPISTAVIGGGSVAARLRAAAAWRMGGARRRAPAERARTGRPALVLAPRELDPAADTLPDRFAWLGPCVDAARREVAMPAAFADLLARGGPLVYCAFGSQGHRMRGREATIRAVLGAARRLPAWRFAVATGDAVDRTRLGPVPTNARVVAEAPQLAMLARAHAMITHAGLNSVKECIAAGVPMLALPLDHDQPGNAARIARLGLGAVAAPAAAAIARGVVELVLEPAHAARVVAFRARVAHYAERRAAVHAVEAVIADAP